MINIRIYKLKKNTCSVKLIYTTNRCIYKFMSLTIFMWYAQYVYWFTLKKILTLEININIENEILFLHTENSRQHPIHVNASHYEVGISIRRQFSLSIRYREWIISSRPIECPKYTVGSLRKILQLVYFQKHFLYAWPFIIWWYVTSRLC